MLAAKVPGCHNNYFICCTIMLMCSQAEAGAGARAGVKTDVEHTDVVVSHKNINIFVDYNKNVPFESRIPFSISTQSLSLCSL